MGIYIAPSAIHGLGIFTDAVVQPGEITAIAFVRVKRTNVFENDYKETLIGKFTNHADAPTAELVIREKDIAIRTIKEIRDKEEITVSYKQLTSLFNNDTTLLRMVKFW